MNKTKFVRWGGFLGALLTGAATIVAGDIATGVGLIAASFSSASLFQ